LRSSILGLGIAACFGLPAGAQTPGPNDSGVATDIGRDSDVVIVSGILPEDMDLLPGSGLVVDQDRLEAMNPQTAKEILRLAPGVAVIEEDALGLKLNVSVRGLNPRRSSRTLLMEDGVPIQPAPYADPSAHYYPPLDRVERVEIRRGSGQIPYGPQSVGGMINFVTHAAPDGPLARLRVEGGERREIARHGHRRILPVMMGEGSGDYGFSGAPQLFSGTAVLF
jgi:Fe(3+) dicitrate transport protein